MPNCNFNACFSGPGYPRSVFTCNCNTGACSGARVVNPDVPSQFAVFTLNAETLIESGEVIPVSRGVFSGTAITDGGEGRINLTAGAYRISYNALAEIPAGGEVRAALFLDDALIPTTESVATGGVADEVSLSNQIIVNLEESGVLTVVNTTGESVNFLTTNVSVDKL